MSDLFSANRPSQEEVYPQVFVLPNFTATHDLLAQINQLSAISPFRKMQTPNGHYTNIPVSNCGALGWVSDASGYRYSSIDPQTNNPWPALPADFIQLAQTAAAKVGYVDFLPDACLINQYCIGSKLGSHQDKNETDFTWPIVSVSIGLNAVFQIYGEQRSGIKKNLILQDGDVMVWGGKSRLIYHGVASIKADPQNPMLKYRYNLTFRRAS